MFANHRKEEKGNERNERDGRDARKHSLPEINVWL